MKKYGFPLLLGTVLAVAVALSSPLPNLFMSKQAISVEAASKSPLNYKNKRLLKGDSFTLKADTNKKITYTSVNKSVASVSKSGVVRARKAGKTIIKAKIGKATYSCKVTVDDTVDLIVFAGQSNMTGRGDAAFAPSLTDGAGYECKVITSPKKLKPIEEPFGMGQDRGAMSDGDLRTGSLVSAFTNAYFKQTNVPIVGVSATVVGSGRVSWSTMHYKEVAKRLNTAQKTLKNKKIKVRHIYMVYMQGENDGFAGCSSKEYIESMELLYKNLSNRVKLDACLMIRVGKYVPIPSLYNKVLKAQTTLCKMNSNFVLVSTKAASFAGDKYAEDGLHIKQAGLNTIGKEAGKYAGMYAKSGIEPSIKDTKYKNTYKPNRQTKGDSK